MATQTTHFNLKKPASADRVYVGDLNDNADIIDQIMYANQEKSEQLADEYNAGTTYNVGDYVRRENYIYKCNTASTTGVWDSAKWDRIMITDELGGGGGSSTLAGLNDVNISSPTDGQALVYDNATQKWVNGAGGGGSSTFAGLNDVSVAGVANKDIARFNSSTQKWEKSSDLTDLELRVSQISASTLGITNGHTILKSDGTAMAQEDDLQFASGYVEDDSVNGKTVYIEMIRISQANYNTLKANGQLKTGAKYFIYDAQPVAINASNLPYSSTQSTKEAIDDINEVVNIHLTGSKVSDLSGVAFEKNGVAYIQGYFHTDQQINGGTSDAVGLLSTNLPLGVTANWMGIKLVNGTETLMRGFIDRKDGQPRIVAQQVIPAGSDVIIQLTYPTK